MAKKEQESFFDQAKAWWETDNAKAIATIIAVLLIPAAVVAWNYASNRDVAIDGVEGDSDNGDQIASDDESTENGEEMQAEEATEEESMEDEAIVDDNSIAQDTGQEPTTKNDAPAVGGLKDISTLPDTDSGGIYDYTVQQGDNVYSISQKVCEDNSYYLKNMRENYLKVGARIVVNCN